MHRRHFLTSASTATLTASLMPRLAFAASGAVSATLRAEPVTRQVLPEGDGVTQMLGFNGSMPGPELRVRQGEMLHVTVQNGLDQGTAVHWHGLRLPNRMDGVPMMTQNLIDPGQSFDYSFAPPDAGTFWYHSHYISYEQVARGLMGPLIVEEAEPPDVDHDITAVIADWLMNEDGSLIEEFNSMHSIAHAGHLGNFARAFLSVDTVRIGDRIRLRLINAATNRIFPLSFEGISGKVVALDGMALPQPRALDGLMLAPAQRADLIVDVTGPVGIDMASRQGPYRLADLAAVGQNTDRQSEEDIPTLPAHGLQAPGAASQTLELRMRGGAMGGQHGGSNIWSFNDVSDMPDAPFGRFARGEVARITLVNDTSFPHGIHLHGHHFYELDGDGNRGDLRDTTLVDARASRDILCRFDNPGKWMVHCHMLSHQVGGMMTWVEVA